MVNGWKVTAICFIILFIVETAGVVWLMQIGLEEINRESTCAINICADYETYYYDSYWETCYCYIDSEVEKTEFIG